MTAPSVAIRALESRAEDMRALQRVLEATPAYAQLLTGAPPGPAEAQSLYAALPEGKSYHDKFVLGVDVDGETVGCIDLVRGYPNPSTAMLGLLLVSETWQRRGVGRRAYALIEDFVRGWRTCDRIRIGVVRTNERALNFWRAMRFEPTGEVKPYRCGTVESDIVVYEKGLSG